VPHEGVQIGVQAPLKDTCAEYHQLQLLVWQPPTPPHDPYMPPFLLLSEYTTIGGGEVTTCKSHERKTAKKAQKPGFAPRWHKPIRPKRYFQRVIVFGVCVCVCARACVFLSVYFLLLKGVSGAEKNASPP